MRIQEKKAGSAPRIHNPLSGKFFIYFMTIFNKKIVFFFNYFWSNTYLHRRREMIRKTIII